MPIKLDLGDWGKLLDEVRKAEGDVKKVGYQCTKNCAEIMKEELKTQMLKADTKGNWGDLYSDLSIQSLVENHGEFNTSIGWIKGPYNPEDLSSGYKVVFINYGTPNRTQHGQIKARGFIQKAKRKAKKPIHEEQEKAFKEILKGLK